MNKFLFNFFLFAACALAIISTIRLIFVIINQIND